MAEEAFRLEEPSAAGGLREEVVAFWRSHQALPAGADAAARAQEVVMVARGPDGRIAGVCTAYVAFSRRLEHPMFHARVFVAPAARRSHLAVRLMTEAIPVMERLNAQRPAARRALGVLVEVEAAGLRSGEARVRQAVWPSSKLAFIGRRRDGAHLRVRYFEGAVLEFPPPPAP